MTSIQVTDNRRCGLHVSVGAAISYWRHSPYFGVTCGRPDRWVVSLHGSLATGVVGEIMGDLIVTRPAVVDDFGCLAFVGPAE